jgi:hypothetical protein
VFSDGRVLTPGNTAAHGGATGATGADHSTAAVAPRAWVTMSQGGTASPLAFARGDDTGRPWAIAAVAPAFRFDGSTWNAVPVRRPGAALLAACGPLAMAAGRRAFAWSGTAWDEMPRTTTPIAALWVRDRHGAIAITTDAQLVRRQGGPWQALPSVSNPRALFGSTTVAVVVDDRDQLWRVDGKQPTRISTPKTLASFRPVLGVSAGPSLWLVGFAANELVVVPFDKKGLGTPLWRAPLPARPDGKTAADEHTFTGALVDRGGALVVSAEGVVWRTSSKGWEREVVTPATAKNAAAPTPSGPASSPAVVGPATPGKAPR